MAEDDIIDKLITSNEKYSDEISKIGAPLIEHMKTRYISYTRVEANGDTIMVNNYPSWFKYYFDNKYYECDHHVVAPKNMHSGFSLWSSGADVRYRGTMLFDAVELFNFNCGISLVRTYDDYYEVFSFNVCNYNKYKAYSKYLNNLFCFEYFANYFKKEAAHIITALPVINMAELKSNFATQIGIVEEIIAPPPLPPLTDK